MKTLWKLACCTATSQTTVKPAAGQLCLCGLPVLGKEHVFSDGRDNTCISELSFQQEEGERV